MSPKQVFTQLSEEFSAFHQTPINNLVHLFTTPLFYTALSSILLNLLPLQSLVYNMLLMPFYPSPYLFFATSALSSGAAGLAIKLGLSLNESVILFVVAYVSQDLAHFIANEPTFQAIYQKKYGVFSLAFWYTLLAHCFFMLPLVIEAGVKGEVFSEVLSWFMVRNRIFKALEKWMDSLNIKPDVTTHVWYCNMPKDMQQAFHRLATSTKILDEFNKFYESPVYTTEVVEAMNEIYIAANDTSKATSDNVFYSKHIDGPFFCYPNAGVFRSVVAVNTNRQIKTIMTATKDRMCLTDGDVAAFDFNREIHYIERDPVDGPQPRRYCLKVHYVSYPTALPWYGKFLAFATSTYDAIARAAFLKTLEPKGIVDQALWAFIMGCTWTFYSTVALVGNSGVISYLLAVGLGSLVLSIFPSIGINPYIFFVVCTSFVHYMIYIATYYHQKTKSVAFEAFKSTVMAYKAIAFIHMAYFYLSNFTFDPVSLTMIAVGFGLSFAALLAIGVDATYFGLELGLLKYGKRITSFPYNILQHPMIVGNCIGLLGIMKMDGFRTAVPWLVPVHISLYVLHMMQEHLDIYKKPKELSEKKEE